MWYERDRVQSDKLLVENTIRPSAIGKRNWLFMGDAQSGARAATFYTLIGNCHRAGVVATTCLAGLFKRLPVERNKTVHWFTPQAWAAEQAATRQAGSVLVPRSSPSNCRVFGDGAMYDGYFFMGCRQRGRA